MKIVFMISMMNSGGAERVMSFLADSFARKGNDVSVLLTGQDRQEAEKSVVFPAVAHVDYLNEIVKKSNKRPLRSRIYMAVSKICPDKAEVWKYRGRNVFRIQAVNSYIKKRDAECVFAFLHDPIYLALLSKPKKTKVIISERGDPNQDIAKPSTLGLIRTLYPKADYMVFQTDSARQWYRDKMNLDGEVISNPIKAGLPTPFDGERKPRIVNFCRYCTQKNLFLLVDAYRAFYDKHPEYDLYVYGPAVTHEEKEYKDSLVKYISDWKCKENIHLLDAVQDIHNRILDAAMFVSSSDYEGMSNSMLESLAIGLPCICTDCPAGGAAAIIRDHENGILVPINDTNALAAAMLEVAEDYDLAQKLSENGRKIRETLSEDKILKKWGALL